MKNSKYKEILKAAGFVYIEEGDRWGFQMYGMRFFSASDISTVDRPAQAVIEVLQSLKEELGVALDEQIKKVKEIK